MNTLCLHASLDLPNYSKYVALHSWLIFADVTRLFPSYNFLDIVLSVRGSIQCQGASNVMESTVPYKLQHVTVQSDESWKQRQVFSRGW